MMMMVRNDGSAGVAVKVDDPAATPRIAYEKDGRGDTDSAASGMLNICPAMYVDEMFAGGEKLAPANVLVVIEAVTTTGRLDKQGRRPAGTARPVLLFEEIAAVTHTRWLGVGIIGTTERETL